MIRGDLNSKSGERSALSIRLNSPLMIFSVLYLLIFPFSLYSQRSSLDPIELEDERTAWKVGVTEFSDKGLHPDQTHLLKALPSLLYQKISFCTDHILSAEERLYLAEERLEREIRQKKKDLSSSQKEFDRLFFDRNATEESRKSKQTSIRNLYLEIERLQLLRDLPERIKVEEQKSIEIAPGKGESPLMEAVSQPPHVFMDESDLDMLVTGHIEQIEGLIYYRAELYARWSHEPLISVRNGGEFSEVRSKVESDSPEFIEQVLGRKWASLIFETRPISAAIRFNDGYKGVGIVNRVYMKPGTYVIRLDAPGYISEEVEVTLKPTDEADFQLSMQKNLSNPLVLQSTPAGADVYLSSEWVGQTPLLIQDAGLDEPYVIRKDGYSDYYGTVEDALNFIDFIQLNSSDYMTDSFLDKKRMDMYDSLTMMAVGVPFFLFGFGYGEKYGDILESPDYQLAQTGNQISKNYFEASTADSGMTLLNQFGLTIFSASIINLFIDMVQYVNVYDNM